MNKLALALAIALGHSARAEIAERSFSAMGTSLEVSIEAPTRRAALDAGDRVFRAVQADERRLSTWIPDSELSRANLAPVGRVIPLSPETAQDLRHATACARRTGFAFTPWIGPLISAWGLRTGGRIPTDAELKRALAASAPDAFGWNQQGLIRNLERARIEEGGFGKGLALDDGIAALGLAGVKSAVLNFGGQLAVLGQGLRPIEISDPTDRARGLLSFESRFPSGQGSIATSGNSEHGIRLPGSRRIGHLISPRTGMPAPFDGSVSIIAPTGLEADCLSKIFILGPAEGLAWANRNRVEALFVAPDPPRPGHWVARASCAWKPALHPLNDSVRVERACAERTLSTQEE